MLAVGRALMANPDLILMDEPSEGLSPKLVQQVEGIMQSMREHGHADEEGRRPAVTRRRIGEFVSVPC